MATATGKSVFIGILVFALIGTLTSPAPAWIGLPALMAMLVAVCVGLGLLTTGLVWTMLAVARASTGTIISAEGLQVRQALWKTSFLRWEDIRSADYRNTTNWHYLYLGSGELLPEVGMSLEFDDPAAFRSAIETFAPADNPVRTALRSLRLAET